MRGANSHIGCCAVAMISDARGKQSHWLLCCSYDFWCAGQTVTLAAPGRNNEVLKKSQFFSFLLGAENKFLHLKYILPPISPPFGPCCPRWTYPLPHPGCTPQPGQGNTPRVAEHHFSHYDLFIRVNYRSGICWHLMWTKTVSDFSSNVASLWPWNDI
jgi:hypothetical protein